MCYFNEEEENEKFRKAMTLFCVLVLTIIILIIYNSCTYNISLVQREGMASDAIDAEQTKKPSMSATIPYILL